MLKKSDAECFSPLADLTMPEKYRPECQVCGSVSEFGYLQEFVDGTLGGGTYIIEFRCLTHRIGPHHFVTSALLYPGWRVSQRREIGVYICQRLTRSEQLSRVRPESGAEDGR